MAANGVQVSGQRTIPIDLDPRAVIELWAQYYQLQVVEQQDIKQPLRQRGRRVKTWTIAVAGELRAINSFWSAFDDWLEARGAD
jgi:hypothetical protein